MSGLVTFLGASAVVIGGLVLVLRALRRWNGLAPGGAADLPMKVLQRVAVGPRQGVALLRIGSRVLVVSVAESGTRLLTELDDDNRAAALRVGEPRPREDGGRRRSLLPWVTLAIVIGAAGVPAGARAQSPAPGAGAAPSAAASPGASAPAARPLPRPLALNASSPAPGPATAATSAVASRLAPRVQGPLVPRVDVRVGEGLGAFHIEGVVGLVVFIGFLTLIPALFLLMTSFTRILIVLHFLRSAIGTQTTPPTQLLVAVAVLLTGVVMNPALQAAQRDALQPYFDGRITQAEAYARGVGPFRTFMLDHLRENDLALFTGLAGIDKVESEDQLPILVVVSAFMTSELRTAFQMGFVIFLPFLVVDVIVASVLMSLGMFMLPPMMVSLPLKLLLFVLADGWTLVFQNLVASFRTA